jgi:N-acetylglutamate synthase-like GNAT family acetyltransferase
VNIDENQRGQNLCARLIAVSLDKARQLGITGAYVVCSSLFSRKAFIRQGFQVINELLYAEHGNGRLTDMGVHDRCTLLARQL